MRCTYRLIILILFILNILVINPSFPQSNPSEEIFEQLLEEAKEAKKTNQVLFNFENIDLNLLTYFITELTDKNIVLGTDLKGTVSLVFSEPVTINQAWDIYTSILKSRGYSIVNHGDYVEILPITKTRTIVPPVRPSGKEGSSELITYVYKLKHGNIFHIMNILRGLRSPLGRVYSYNPANVIIITDTSSNIKNLKRILAIVDTAEGGIKIKIYKLKYSNSTDISRAINIIFSDLTRKGIPVKTYSIRNQNVLLVKASENILKEVDRIVNELDEPTDNISYRKFWTIHLKNAKAKNIANILNKLLNSVSFVNIPEEKKSKKSRSKYIISSIGKGDKPKVIADESSNSIVIYANKVEFEAIKNLIKNLDKQKKQVLITAFIAEVSESALKQMGVRWQIFGSNGGASFRGGLSNGSFYSNFSQTNFVVGGISTNGRSVTVNGNALFFPDLLFVFSLLESGSGFNVISSPKILVMDNTKAKINVSQVVPYAQGVKYDVNGNPIINYDYKEVGLILQVTPHISGKNIMIELHQEVNDVIGFEQATVGNLSYVVPRTSKRELDTMITVENGKTIVLGGLVSKKTVQTMEGVPILSQLPIIGNLFQYKSVSKEKTNLFVFITPYIIEKPEDLAKITEEHMKLVKKLRNRQNGVIRPEGNGFRNTNVNSSSGNMFEDYRKYFGY